MKKQNTVHNPTADKKHDTQINMKKVHREREAAERENDEHWKHRSQDHDDDDVERVERSSPGNLGKGKLMNNVPRQRDTGNTG